MKSKAVMWIMGYELIKVTLVFLFFGSILSFINAHQLFFPTPENYNESIPIDNPIVAKTYYGNLENFPHTYTLKLTETTAFTATLHTPEAVNETNRSALLVKKERRGVSEVARLKGNEASWEPFYDTFTGETYRKGPTIETTLEPGDYIFEVSTPDNLGPYVLMVGSEGKLSDEGFIQTLKDIYHVKKFLNQSGISVLLSPFYYVPALALLTALLILWYRHRKHYA